MKRVIALLTAVVMTVSAFTFTIGVSATEETTQPSSETVETTAATESTASEESSETESETSASETSTEASETTTEPSETTTEPSETAVESSETEPSEPVSSVPEESSENTEVTTESTEATTATPVKKPAAVSSFKVTKKAADFLKLEWKKSKEADKYYLYRAVEGKNSEFNFNLYKQINKSKTSFVDRKVESGKVYKYRLFVVRVNKGKVVKSYSKGASAFTPLLATGKLKVKDCTATKIVLAWRKIKNASKYEIYRKGEGEKDYKKIATTTSTTYKDTKITSGANYSYKVRGYRVAVGKKRYSPFVKVLASAGEFGVKGITAKSYLCRGLFTWSAVSGVNGYDIFLCKDNGEEVYQDTTTATNYLTKRLKSGKSYTYSIKSFKKFGGEKIYGKARKVKVNIVSTAYGKSAGNNYIEVCLETQTVNMVIDGKQYITSPVVTGMYHVYDTTRGFHRIISKKSPATLRGSAGGSSWNVGVSFWLGFTWDGQGLHDSTWRTSGYGGNVYKGNGSHGCVNTPYNAMKKIYSKAYAGMPVIVY